MKNRDATTPPRTNQKLTYYEERKTEGHRGAHCWERCAEPTGQPDAGLRRGDSPLPARRRKEVQGCPPGMHPGSSPGPELPPAAPQLQHLPGQPQRGFQGRAEPRTRPRPAHPLHGLRPMGRQRGQT